MATPNSVAIEILEEFEKATDDAGFVTRVEKRVNNGLDKIAIATNWNSFKTRDTFSTAATVPTYNMPVGAREIIQLRYLDTGEPISLLTTQEAARRGIKLEDPGRAISWLEDGVVVSGSNTLLRIRLAPIPSSILTIEREYYFHPSDVASATVLPIQDQHVDVVKDYVRYMLYMLDQKYDAADRAMALFNAALNILVKKEARKVAAMPVLKQTDLSNIRRVGRPIFDPSHFNNGLG